MIEIIDFVSLWIGRSMVWSFLFIFAVVILLSIVALFKSLWESMY